MTYKEARAFLNKGRNKTYRPLPGRSTCIHLLPSGDIAIKYHYTNVLTIHSDNSYTLHTGGYHTVTTKARINLYLPFKYGRVFTSFDRMWFSKAGWGKNAIPFYEGMRVKKGKVINRDPISSIERLGLDYEQAGKEYRRKKYIERKERLMKENPLAFTKIGKFI